MLFDLEMKLASPGFFDTHTSDFINGNEKEVLDMLEFINAILIQFNRMMWNSYCPMKEFLGDFFVRRDFIKKARKRKTLAVLKLQCREITRIVSELEVMGEYVRM